jgi:hypothetical protein
MRPTNENPNLAPAVVDDNKWEPPIAAPASNIPGPKLFCIPFVKFMFLIKNLIYLLSPSKFIVQYSFFNSNFW